MTRELKGMFSYMYKDIWVQPQDTTVSQILLINSGSDMCEQCICPHIATVLYYLSYHPNVLCKIDHFPLSWEEVFQ